ncbi:hypothetical protein APR50_03950 [Variovorax paradoxus]|jgi:tripartite-type tricarboxylate transporter receptor subunit TctC|uniref:tripartite tricarboxylate transporter substrate binding protein n=1 Tax=Variovorax TaxID=34072 RepID=UPI0006E56171|nr:tripartite tricarboxylate transporter substrate binding protein [Variovorax sp. CY25R-8]KPU95829.1 hypothetical protein APR52_16600 [Variovorax paradoxus]KPV11227.1 hypothetical protein APR50_03950 [Variovorax paradoxus]KPV13136.1 hypothetical protein APR49_04520 [Variovorax paradoxus]KPV21243.1 hypothetical protein APR51_14510 [Variovorax paradoxus]KPV24187.1 hypothetical protein APR47_36360 [Variovorax paradoxus]
MSPLISRRQGLAWAAALVPALALPRRAFAAATAPAAWPTRPLHIVVPYPAGGTPDTLARQLGPSLQSQLGQPVVVEAKPGASGLIAARSVSKGTPDAHNFLSLSSGIVTLSAMNPKFDLLKELKPVTRLTTSPFVCVVAADSRIASMRELIAMVRDKPGSLSYGSAGPGSPAHLAVEYLADATGNFKALHVPYKGAVESINALIGGQIDFSILVLGAAMPLIASGKLRALATTGTARVPQLAQVPTIAESGGGRYAFESWGGMAMHADTPDDIAERAIAAFRQAMGSEEVKRLLASTGSYPAVSRSRAEFVAALETELDGQRQIVKRLGLVSG